MDASSCCNDIVEEADGYMYCTKCGKLVSQSLETSSTAYNQSTYFMPRGYTRRSRFVKKVLGSLRLRATHKIDEALVIYLKEQDVKTPTGLLAAIGKYPAKGRRPYQFSMFYWKALGFPVPRCTDQDVDLLVREFDNILFAWERYRFQRPKFPYSFLFRKLVAAGTQYSTGIKQFIPFVRKLRCQRRKERYERLYKMCSNFNYQNVRPTYEMDTEQKIDETEVVPSSEGQTTFYREICTGKKLSVFDTKGTYKSQLEVDNAVKHGDFDIARTMYVAPNGEFYFLCYNDLGAPKQREVSLRNMRVSNAQPVELSASRKLDAALRAQSSI